MNTSPKEHIEHLYTTPTSTLNTTRANKNRRRQILLNITINSDQPNAVKKISPIEVPILAVSPLKKWCPTIILPP